MGPTEPSEIERWNAAKGARLYSPRTMTGRDRHERRQSGIPSTRACLGPRSRTHRHRCPRSVDRARPAGLAQDDADGTAEDRPGIDDARRPRHRLHRRRGVHRDPRGRRGIAIAGEFRNWRRRHDRRGSVLALSGRSVLLPREPHGKGRKTVTWVNKDTVTHTVTSDGSSLFDSGFMPTGATFQFTFTMAGTYPYYCTVHPFMKGTVVVTP